MLVDGAITEVLHSTKPDYYEETDEVMKLAKHRTAAAVGKIKVPKPAYADYTSVDNLLRLSKEQLATEQTKKDELEELVDQLDGVETELEAELHKLKTTDMEEVPEWLHLDYEDSVRLDTTN
ncbi:PREDICTED: uncharacterized protein LOC106816630 [Priapulus caudatus]|uniref:Uncharacterized protein LOC106816630 n=1 Tax=Priapulus caudatus TaxID=37621 RepID=A0ABM1EX19_PRICU|nr:PREDICTED: uncharacterized protein LOC106816630 [Priapulus caudatus]